MPYYTSVTWSSQHAGVVQFLGGMGSFQADMFSVQTSLFERGFVRLRRHISVPGSLEP